MNRRGIAAAIVALCLATAASAAAVAAQDAIVDWVVARAGVGEAA